MRCSRLTVFFLDSEQSFRSRENTSIEDIEKWAHDLGATIEMVSLRGNQFRCAGSVEYVEWVESLLKGESAAKNRIFASAWNEDMQAHTAAEIARPGGNVIAFPGSMKVAANINRLPAAADPAPPYGAPRSRGVRTKMDFRIFSDPFLMESELRSFSSEYTIRLLSSFSRDWKTEKDPYPHEMPAAAQDFYEPVTLSNGEPGFWYRPWNYVPKKDYTWFIAGRMGQPISRDSLCEVGCTYAVRGFDFDYIGLLWLNDLLWRDARWIAPLENVHESGIDLLVKQARRERRVNPAGPKGAEVLEKVCQAYRILLTRAIRGVFVWIPDEETRVHVAASLSKR
jgi:DUF2075 family protein